MFASVRGGSLPSVERDLYDPRRMRPSLRSCTLVFAAFVAAALPKPAQAKPAATSDAVQLVIVLDDSGSMQHSDPRRLSVTAAMMAVQLAGQRDRIALVPLGGAGTRLGPGGARGTALLRRLQGLQRRAARTIYDRPLERALGLLRQTGSKTRLLLFLTDGEPDGGRGSDAAKLATRHETYLDGLARHSRGVRIFPVMLGQLPARWATRLVAVARASSGRAFPVASAEKLIEVFASIHASLLGSKVVMRELKGGRTRLARFDDYVRYANLVIVSRSGPFTVRYPGQKGGGKALDNGADRRRDGQKPERVYHFVDRLPPRGELAVELSGASAYRALLIWDYDLSLVLAKPERKGGAFALTATLQRKSLPGQAVDKKAFLEGTRVVPRICPGACSRGYGQHCAHLPPMRVSCVAGRQPSCRYESPYVPPKPGTYCVDATARRSWEGHEVLSLSSTERHELLVAQEARLTARKEGPRFRLDQNLPKKKWQSCQTVTLAGSGLSRPETLLVETTGLKLPRGTTLTVEGSPQLLPKGPAAQGTLRLCLRSKRYVDDAFKSAGLALHVRAKDASFFAPNGQSMQLPLSIEITPCSFWNRYKGLILKLGIALLVLLFLLWLIIGIIKPHDFPENLQVNWGQSIERLDRNAMPLSEVRGTSRGFYRNAQLWIGGSRCFLQSGWPARARFEAMSRRGIKLFAEDGVELERINKFDSERRDAITSGATATVGDIYKIGDLFVRLKL